ncbi:membrane protease YdiL (CAAX protease family) [Aequitasia blattaphilus]|uniref:CPBP family intramembrane metalloprotease n=1 Tax=Aequitasia blattaphilus TaxID=2949332 RepID=A0ABT1EBY5_9FIRM|nr:CPBP family intramembrane glutamic endopeptidase [Aequitasia blattaphilus]MCP1103332.1 CPBP family intramembrane metalloprotease [Aequitasia blattaphilus]MCR8615972.1 CPBP family intramembrane metalloprotease [Aequitasia blattaphilus]
MNLSVNQVIKRYLTISFGIMTPMCVLMLALNAFKQPIYGSVYGIIVLAVGGLSTAVAGAFTAKRYEWIDSCFTLLKEFLNVKQPIRYYVAIIGFLFILFATRILKGQLQAGKDWIDLPGLFLAAILFGGIEEIGWRYLLGSALESKFSFGISSMLVTILWGIWHIMFFVVDGSILIMQPQDIGLFLISLFGTAFVLGAIYHITKSLWLCVFYHALLNAFMQVIVPASIVRTILTSIICVVVSLVVVRQKAEF